VITPYEADFHAATQPKKLTRVATDKQDTHLSFEARTKKVKPLQLVCVDHRDSHNKKVDPQSKKGSLFKYLESKRSQFDFHGKCF
jgi:hypothetical protein